MGREQLEALVRVLQEQLGSPDQNLAIGTWSIHYDKVRAAFTFDKCENDGYCEERPAVIGLTGDVLDKGGPLFGG
jgi:hypothetical protein